VVAVAPGRVAVRALETTAGDRRVAIVRRRGRHAPAARALFDQLATRLPAVLG